MSSIYGNSTSSESNNYAFISVTPGYYLIDRLSIEPEIGLLSEQHYSPSQYLLLNLSYTYMIPDSKEALYARAGYGIANSVQLPIMSSAIANMSDKLNIGIFNVGVDAKFLLTQSVALRTELNCRSHKWSNSSDFDIGSSYTSDMSMSNVGLLLGFSILL
jgi:hypothetical protein